MLGEFSVPGFVTKGAEAAAQNSSDDRGDDGAEGDEATDESRISMLKNLLQCFMNKKTKYGSSYPALITDHGGAVSSAEV